MKKMFWILAIALLQGCAPSNPRWEYGMLYNNTTTGEYAWISKGIDARAKWDEFGDRLVDKAIIASDAMVSGKSIGDLMDGLGSKGWELVGMSDMNGGKLHILAFKRRMR